ncbi:adenosine deaminase 2-like isoform X2 [Neocloeon triangulifer]|nr:adenosine deaminase 2-like isoform X2 [Neocloeon triangulifer]
MVAKRQIYENCFDQMCFPPARHFFDAKADIESSEVFRLIKLMPKGAALHGHDTGMVGTEWLIKNATMRSDLWACTKVSTSQPTPPMELDLLKMIFAPSVPAANTCPDGAWISVATLRTTNPTEVDPWFEHFLSLVTPDPTTRYPNVNVAWEYFSKLFDVTGGLLSHTPVFRDYFTQTLRELKDDNVQYLELRGLMLPTYNLDGSTLDTMQVATLYAEANAEFSGQQVPGEWFGSRFIYAPTRNVDNATVDTYVQTAEALIRAHPNYLAGFDLVGQEDKGRPLVEFINQMFDLRAQVPDVKFFFHAGETNWQGETDLNIIDALLLNTTRIGHGFAISKHPAAKRLAAEKGVAIEVNPISNQVLKLVEDLRNHPVSTLLAEDFPVVVSCDDPSFWGAKGLSYDFYQMFMGIASKDADLRFLKQLAINSLQYSSMPADEKTCALEAWAILWDRFIASVLGNPAPTNKKNRAACVTIWNNNVKLQTNEL